MGPVRGVLLDTSVLVEIERGTLDPGTALAGEDGPFEIAVAAISIAELLLGACLAAGVRAERRQAFAEHMIESYPVVQYDVATARHHAELLAHCRRTGTMRGDHDLIIAATARATGRTVVTLDRKGFEGLPDVRVR